jgi:hypothetical protein
MRLKHHQETISIFFWRALVEIAENASKIVGSN